MRKIFTLIVAWWTITGIVGQTSLPLQLQWQEDKGEQLILRNEGHDSGNLPIVFRRIPLSSNDSIRVRVLVEEEKRYSQYNSPDRLGGNYKIITRTETDQGRSFGVIYLYPIRSNPTGDITVLLKGQLDVEVIPGRPRIQTRNNNFTSKSVLSEGRILKIPITETDIYRINFEQLPMEWTNQNFNPDRLQLFAGHPGPLPYGVGDEKIDDLQEVPLYMDGTMTSMGDGLVFYAVGSRVKIPSGENGFMTIHHNVYADTNFYFLRYGVEVGKRLTPPDNLTTRPTNAVTIGSDVWRYEEDNYNILESIIQGSGRTWYTDAFTGSASRDYTNLLRDLPIDPNHDVVFSAAFAGRSDFRNTVTFEVGNETFSKEMLPVQMSDRYGTAAQIVSFQEKLRIATSRLILRHQTQQSNSRGWLDYLELAFTKPLQYRNAPLQFYHFSNQTTFQIAGAGSGFLAMETTDPFDTQLLPTYLEQNNIWFQATNLPKSPRKFVVFNPKGVRSVSGLRTIRNQNLHDIQELDYLIVYHPLFEQSVQRLANHRRQHNGFDVKLASIYDIYHEFSSGKTDPSALRNFIKMLYSRGNSQMRVLLFGDGSFDYKHNSDLAAYPDENFIPVFETENSHIPIRAFPSDDYYALMDDWEGGDLRGALDISLGRIPVRTQAEADIMVQKIITYETDPLLFGDWRKEILMVADDGNFNLFLGYTERLTQNIESQAPEFQISKAYVDAFPKEISPNGELTPRTTEMINNGAYEGRLMINYQGHGSSKGWGDEAILSKIDLEKWNNDRKYPVLVTATCTFAGYDDPKEVTAGEYALTLPDKGAIALFSTTRVVYANSNDRLTNSLFNRLLERLDAPPELGEWIRLAKNANRSDTLDINARKFALLGDPAMKIAVPQHQIIISDIDGKDPSSTDSIRIGALQKVTIKGFLANHQGQKLTAFNGELYPTLFDKKKTLKTLGQGNNNYEEEYSIWQNILYKGRASVTQGEFEFDFIVPRDINYSIGYGRLSLYAHDGSQEDAWGQLENVLIGGTAENPIENDQRGPSVEIYLGDKRFMNGDEVEPNTLLLLDIEDPSGINVSGNGIGHDLIYYLDGQIESSTVLNNYFQYDLNSYSKGSLEFPISNLEPGKHSLTIKVWDSYNNLTEKTVEFYVNKKELAIRNVLNYPNPFFDRTEFQFENPLVGDDISIVIDIFTPSGRIVHRIVENRNSSAQQVRGLYWNGRDQWQQKLANGVYIYKIKLIEQSGNKKNHVDSGFQKLLLLN